MSSEIKPPTLNADSITEATRIVTALPNELPPEVQRSAAELVSEIVRDLKASIPDAKADTAARDQAIDVAVSNATAAVERVLPTGPVRTNVVTKLAELGALVKAGATHPSDGNARRRLS